MEFNFGNEYAINSFIFYSLFVAGCDHRLGSCSNTPSYKTPSGFNFTAATNTELTLDEVKVIGLNAATTITMINGEHDLDGDDYTSSNGVVVDDHTVTFRLTTLSELTTETVATLTFSINSSEPKYTL